MKMRLSGRLKVDLHIATLLLFQLVLNARSSCRIPMETVGKVARGSDSGKLTLVPQDQTEETGSPRLSHQQAVQKLNQ